MCHLQSEWHVNYRHGAGQAQRLTLAQCHLAVARAAAPAPALALASGSPVLQATVKDCSGLGGTPF